MQTSLRRRRRRTYGNGYTSHGGGTARRLAIAIPLFLFTSFLFLASVGFFGVVAAYSFYSQGLPDPRDVFENLSFNEPTIIYDKTGKVELARFALEKREVVIFDQIPAVVVDATTAIEDKTFWENAGFDPIGIISAGIDSLRGNERGASTITQQLVRARLLPEWAFAGTRYERKLREIIQSIRLTQALPPGREGKEAIIAAYLNQNFYGNQLYGIAAAAKGYFGLADIRKISLAQAAILAGIPQSPSTYDLARNAVEQEILVKGETKTILVVPPDSPIVQRRNHILELMKTRSPLTGTEYTLADYDKAMEEQVIIQAPRPVIWRAPHFVWQVRHQLGVILCGEANADTCEKIDTGGYRVTTTLDWKMQQVAEKWLSATVFAPHQSSGKQSSAKQTASYLKLLKLPNLSWVQNLRPANVYNGALAAIDYRTGQVLAYAGSGGYYAVTRKSRRFQPQFDVLADGWRQPGSSIKPINYITGIDDKTMTAATLFMDVVTDFTGRGYTPTQADFLERGPVRLREALQFSLNIPAIKAGMMNGRDHYYRQAKEFGLTFPPGIKSFPISMGIGLVEIHPIELLSAYGAIANGGVLIPRTMVISVTDQAGNRIWPTSNRKPAGKAVVTPQAAYIVTDIMAGNNNPKINPFWGEWGIREKGKLRPTAFKTGTTPDNKDVHTYGYVAPPKDPRVPAIAAGVWLGNSDASPMRVISLQLALPLWSSFMTEATKGTPVASFGRPPGIVEAKIDAHSGMLPGPYTSAKNTITEVFIEGTVPLQIDNTKQSIAVDAATGKRWRDGCVGPRVTRAILNLSAIEAGFPQWAKANRGWIARAARGQGVAGGPNKKARTRTSYFYGQGFYPFGRTWGAGFAPSGFCDLAPPPTPIPTDTPLPTDGGETPAPSP